MLVDKKILAKTVFKPKDYPSFIVDKINQPSYKKPSNANEMQKFWKGIERLIKQYAFRLSGQYKVDQEELIQQSYLFVVELLNKYQPAFPCDYIYSNVCNSRCQFWKKCHKQEYFGWQTYELKPYLFYNIYQKMRDFSQKDFKYQKRFFDLDFSTEGSDADDSSDVVLAGLSNKKSMTAEVERKIISEILYEALTDVLDISKGTKKEVGYLFFKKHFSEKQIHENLGKSQSTINTHISAIKKQILTHPKVIDLMDSLKNSGITIDDILGE